MMGKSFLSYEFLQLDRPINIGFRKVPTIILEEQVSLRPISLLAAFNPKALAEQSKLRSM
jgi:hypothetical protein